MVNPALLAIQTEAYQPLFIYCICKYTTHLKKIFHVQKKKAMIASSVCENICILFE
jgi:hypothetical protein